MKKKKPTIHNLVALGINPNTPLNKISAFDQQIIAMSIWGTLSEPAKDVLIDYMAHKGETSVSVLTMYNFVRAYAKKDKVVRFHFYFNEAMRKLRPWGQVTRPGFMLP